MSYRSLISLSSEPFATTPTRDIEEQQQLSQARVLKHMSDTAMHEDMLDEEANLLEEDEIDVRMGALANEIEQMEEKIAKIKAEEKPLGFFTGAWKVLKTSGMICYVLCPPVPERITRKVAFHPPKCTYSARLESNPKKKITNAKKLQNKEFVLQPKQSKSISQGDYDRIMEQCEPFTVKTRKSVLVGACFRPSSPIVIEGEESERMINQVIIFAQPNGSDLGGFMQPHSVSFAAIANALHIDVYAFDYSGYGLSSGSPSEKNMYADIHAVYEHVRRERPDKKICLMGFSIGTAAVTDLASLQPEGLSGVILIAPFTSALRLIGQIPKQEQTGRLDRFKSYEKIGKVAVPVLLIHGVDDEMISMKHSKELHRHLQHPVDPLFVEGADHMSIFRNMETFRRIYEFLTTETFVDAVSVTSSSEHPESN